MPLAAALLLVLLPALAVAQPAPAGAAPPQTARAAGMALHDGTLPPGTLTARIVQGTFSGNVSGVRVTLETEGQASKEATTGADGRAQFAHLTVGTKVRVMATVDGERLESESIVLPAESGVRVLLVAGDRFVDTTKPGQVAELPAITTAPPLPPGTATPASTTAPSASAPSTTPAAAADTGVATLRLVMIALTILAFAAVAYGQWRRRA
jgi:hypothetical protein